MPHPHPPFRFAALATLLAFALPSLPAAHLGLFTDHTDIGPVQRPGTVAYEAATRTYTVGGSGANMWFAHDEFHFVWKKTSGNTALSAAIDFTGAGTNGHRKAILMIRQSLAPDSAYVDAALHADGLTSLQFRETAGGNTAEIQAPLNAPRRLRLEKIGDWAYLLAGPAEGPLTPTGASIQLPFTGDFYVGIGVCAHDADEFETVAFTNVEIATPTTSSATAIRSIIEIMPHPSGDRRALHATTDTIDALAWPRADEMIFQSRDRRHRLPLTTLADGKLAPAAAPSPVDDSSRSPLESDSNRILSPDGQWIACLRHQPPTP